jgi:AraC-like DNA-binding protein
VNIEQFFCSAKTLTLSLSEPDRWHVVPKRYRADTMRQFEDALAAHRKCPPSLQDLCMSIGVPERTLRLCCTEFLGMAPTRYFRLRRLGMVRAALRRADPATANVSNVAAWYGFRQPGKFAAQYRAVFGEGSIDHATPWPKGSVRRHRCRIGINGRSIVPTVEMAQMVVCTD